ncbi:LacI family transcriptional regulator [Nakamurella sp. UYEF19]|uniref:LacI family DNA-binding transcriptional regulator n=1 Tax=Nakamurella sp. UYEF19 TaxID=1756392 RepID=UPI00339AB785
MSGEVSVIDVAKKAGVSLGTVSNVLNRPERVAPATRARVLAAIEELGFIRNEAARQLRAGRSRSIGLVVLDIRNPFFTDLAAGVESSVADAGLSLVLCNSGDDPTREDHYLSLLQEQRATGILITPAARATSPIEGIRRRGMPLVLVDRSSHRRQCSVSVDDLVGGELAIDHLISLGHKRITFVGGPLSTKQVADRLRGARAAAERAGLRVTVMETDGQVFGAGRTMGERIAAMPARRRPTAVFCGNDLIALGVLQEMTRHHIVVPDDLAIVGYDDIDFAGAAAVPLTSVRQPREDLGRTAAELLIEEVVSADSHRHRQVVFEPDLIVRASTAQS